MKKYAKLLWLLPLLVSCGGETSSDSIIDSADTSSGTNSSDSTSKDTSSGTSTIDYDTFEKYKKDLENKSEDKHFYLHYYRYKQEAADFNQFDVWAWNKSTGSEGVRFDWVGRTTSTDRLSATGNAVIDELGYVNVDIDLSKDYKGGWDNSSKKMLDKPVSFKNTTGSDLLDVIGVQIVKSDSRTTGSSFWANDGGDQFHVIKSYALVNGDKTSYHVFVTQDNVDNPMTLEKIGEGATYIDPFENDDGTNVTYGKAEYADVDFSKTADTPSTSETFLASVGAGYQIMVSSFSDSDGDGFGDIYGIYKKLDYIAELGVKAIWLTPIQLSDSYHGYDISDYLTIDSKYGSTVSDAALKNGGVVTNDTAKADYAQLIEAAHNKGIKVVMDLVINHTSITNKWFTKSAKLDKALRGYYQWGNNSTDSKNINEDKCWYPYGDHVYSFYAKFGTTMPELNFSYVNTREAVKSIALNWLEFGVDGFRMDAVKHIYMRDEVKEDNSDTIVLDVTQKSDYSSNLTKNLHFWKYLNGAIKEKYPNAFIVGENFDGHAYHVAPYYEGFDSLFDFYSYFNLTSLSAKANNSSLGYSMTASKFLGATNGDSYSANSDSSLAGNKNTSVKYTGTWDLRSVLSVNNQYRGGSAMSKSSTSGYTAINGAFTSNHDIARTINRVAGTSCNNDGLTAQGNVTTSNYSKYDQMATTVQIAELMLPGCTWIYYGDELGMTGNFASGENANSSYSDLAYRQPMKWVQDGSVGDGNYTTQYSVTGSAKTVQLDDVNKSSTVKSVAEKDESNHYNAIKDFTVAKNSSQTLIKGNFVPNAFNSNNYVLNFDRVLGSEKYTVQINMSGSTVNTSLSGDVVASYNNATLKSLPAYSAILVKVSGSSGGDDPTPTPSETKTYTITNLPSWIADNDCVIFAWAWGGSAGDGVWYPTTKVDEISLTFEAPSDITGCLLVRCVKGTTTPNWSENGDNVGRIYNQTENLTVSDTMSAPDKVWKGYSPS